MLFRRYPKQLLRMTNMSTSSMPAWKQQQQKAYQQGAKNRVPWKTLAVRKKRDNVKTASQRNKRNVTNANAQKHKKVQRYLINVSQKEQIEYIQGQINKTRTSVEDRQSRIAWQTVNKVSKKKCTSRDKLKAASQDEWIHLWKEFFPKFSLAQSARAVEYTNCIYAEE